MQRRGLQSWAFFWEKRGSRTRGPQQFEVWIKQDLSVVLHTLQRILMGFIVITRKISGTGKMAQCVK